MSTGHWRERSKEGDKEGKRQRKEGKRPVHIACRVGRSAAEGKKKRKGREEEIEGK